ncbi:hypothetical protein IC614_00200 [Allosphingosinicella flava]|uniref:Uncharacterized protein n=1 Tax=Allosphingosinicella flava TaxID=2771430 RepID=A0A7T2LMH2_9SPHN|nr:hypothetical protein [Sphingosinicella flava]QPQ55087.1 hypothetical protein IC614_00200 [Sphingosinicella flava]
MKFLCAGLTSLFASGLAVAQDRYAVVDFSVEITGNYSSRIRDGSTEDIDKSRIFTGRARLKFLAKDTASYDGVAPTFDPSDYKPGAAEMNLVAQMQACESRGSERAMKACQAEVAKRLSGTIKIPDIPEEQWGKNDSFQGDKDTWGSEDCTGKITVADRGKKFVAVDAGEGESGSFTTDYSVTGEKNLSVEDDEKCSFLITVDNKAKTADVDLGTSVFQIDAEEASTGEPRKIRVQPFTWSSLTKFSVVGAKVSGAGGSATGTWTTSEGKPVEIVRATKQEGKEESASTTTTIKWVMKPLD